MAKSALMIGSFTKTEHGFTGKLETLAHKGIGITLQPNDDKQKDSHPDYIVIDPAKREVGVAWNRNDDRGYYVSIAFEEPSLAPGFYTLVKSDKGISAFDLLYRKPMPPKKA
jgi:uncharacterized protein (DUF736 family)